MGCYESKIPYSHDFAIEHYLKKTKLIQVTCKQLKEQVSVSGLLNLGQYLDLCDKLKISLPWTFFTENSSVRSRVVLITLCIMCGDTTKHKYKLIRRVVDHSQRGVAEYLELYYSLKHYKVPFWAIRHLLISKAVAQKHAAEYRANAGHFIIQHLKEVGKNFDNLKGLGLLSLISN